MVIKIIILAFLVTIVVSLFWGFFYLLHDDSTRDNRRTLLMLKIRVAASIVFIVFVALGLWMGWIHPHGPLP